MSAGSTHLTRPNEIFHTHCLRYRIDRKELSWYLLRSYKLQDFNGSSRAAVQKVVSLNRSISYTSIRRNLSFFLYLTFTLKYIVFIKFISNLFYQYLTHNNFLLLFSHNIVVIKPIFILKYIAINLL